MPRKDYLPLRGVSPEVSWPSVPVLQLTKKSHPLPFPSPPFLSLFLSPCPAWSGDSSASRFLCPSPVLFPFVFPSPFLALSPVLFPFVSLALSPVLSPFPSLFPFPVPVTSSSRPVSQLPRSPCFFLPVSAVRPPRSCRLVCRLTCSVG